MPTFQDIRSFLRRKLSRFDLRSSQAGGLVATAGAGAPAMRGGEPGDAAVATNGNGAGGATATQRRSTAPTGDAILERLDEHLDARTRHESALLKRLDPLREAGEALPLVARRLNDLMDSLAAQASASEERDDALRSAINRLETSSGRQAEALEAMSRQIAASAQTTDELSGAVDGLRGAVAELGHAQVTSHDALTRLTEAIRRRDSELATALGRMQRWMMGTVICCGGATLAALAAMVITIAF